MNKIAVIPVRSGSKRLPKKNYKSFNSRTLAEIARDKCLNSGIFDKVIITSDDPVFEELVNSNEVEFLQRTKNLAGDDATTDMVIDFFFEEFPSCESVLWVNSVSPLQSIEDIKNCGTRLNNSDVDCVMAINTLYQHCCIANEPLNFNPNNSFEKTQDLKPVQRYVYSCMGWKRSTYVKYRSDGFKGLFPGKMALVEVSVLAGMLIKYEEDFILCSKIEESMGLVPKVKKLSVKNGTNYKQNDNSSNLHVINF
jgi:CMP-N-acetylneuraminic acid synthetase